MGTEEGLKNLFECNAEVNKHVDSILGFCRKIEWQHVAPAILLMKKDIGLELDEYNKLHPDPDWELTFEAILCETIQRMFAEINKF